jgi:tetratricopeptide (TPR) repeat protein
MTVYWYLSDVPINLNMSGVSIPILSRSEVAEIIFGPKSPTPKGPVSIGMPTEGRRGVIYPDAAMKGWTKIVRLIFAYIESSEGRDEKSSSIFESILTDFQNSEEETTAFHHMAGIGRQFLWESAHRESDFNAAEKHYVYAAIHCQDSEKSAVCVNSRINLGVLYLSRGNIGASEKWFLDSLRFPTPARHISFLNLGTLYKRSGKMQEAENAYRQALIIKPDFFTGTLNMGNLLMEEKRWSDAEYLFRRAIKLQPKDHRAYFNLGQCLIQQGNIKEGTGMLQRAQQLDPEHVKILPTITSPS